MNRRGFFSSPLALLGPNGQPIDCDLNKRLDRMEEKLDRILALFTSTDFDFGFTHIAKVDDISDAVQQGIQEFLDKPLSTIRTIRDSGAGMAMDMPAIYANTSELPK